MLTGGFQGGGVDFPEVLSAGDTVIYAKQGMHQASNTSFAYCGVGWGFVAVKAKTVRIHYSIETRSSYASYEKLRLNGIDVPNSEITSSGNPVQKTIDVALSVGDRIELWERTSQMGEFTGYTITHKFEVFISAPEVQAAINDILTPTAT